MSAVQVSSQGSQGHTSSGTSLSLTTAVWTASTYVTVGDLLIATVAITSNNHALSAFSTPAGWTLGASSTIANSTYVLFFYKIVTSSTDQGNFTLTFTSAATQICSWGAFVLDYSGTSNGSNIQYFSQTTSSATMTMTATPTYAGSLGAVGYVDSTQPSTLSFSGTGPTYDNVRPWRNRGSRRHPKRHERRSTVLPRYDRHQLVCFR
jgi:hypothetical protein